MRSLKIFTTFCLVATAVFLAGWPWLVGTRPAPDAPRAAYRAYAQRSSLYLVGLVVLLVGSGVGAAIILRRAREEYREASLENMKQLVEQTRDVARKKQAEEADGNRPPERR